jgi:hypothetical protein
MPRGHYLAEAVKDAIWVLRAEGVSDENDDLAWPHRDGLIWPHFASVVVGLDVA